MINLTDDQWAQFREEGWERGFEMIATLKAQQVNKDFRTLDPANAPAVAKLQKELEIWTKDIPSVAEGLKEFLKRENATRQTR